MPPRKKQSGDSTAPKTQEKWKPVPANFTQRQLDGLDEIAKADKKTRSEVIRDAVDYYLSHVNEGKWEAREGELARALNRIEDRLSKLLLKNIRINGQTLYWTTLPYITGLPKGRLFEKDHQSPKLEMFWAKLNQAGVNQHWNKSAAFAETLLKARPTKDVGIEALKAEETQAKTDDDGQEE